jgi:hypothetical protein
MQNKWTCRNTTRSCAHTGKKKGSHISSTPYIPNDNFALLFNGSKRWPSIKTMTAFGVNQCELSPDSAKAAIEQVCAAVAATRGELTALMDSADDARSAAALGAVSSAWEDGLTSTCGRSSHPVV